MTLSSDDWIQLKELQKRIAPLPPASRRILVHKIVGPLCDNSPFAEILAINGQREFFDALDQLWQTIEDESYIHDYIENLEPLTLNRDDKKWIQGLLRRVKFVPPPAKETNILAKAALWVLQQNETLKSKLLSALKHVDSVEIPGGIETEQQLMDGFLAHDFPLMCFRGTLDACLDRRIRFEEPSAKKDLTVLKDLFMVASFPGDDKKILVEAMQGAWNGSKSKAGSPLQTTDKLFAEDMLISTWMQVSKQELEDWEILKLLHRDPNYPVNKSERDSVLFRRVHVLSQPSGQRPDDMGLAEWYAECCICEYTGKIQKPASPIAEFNEFLAELAKRQAIAAMFITKEFQEGIDTLTKHCPSLVLVILSATDASRYSSIYRELAFTDSNLARICRS
ncbi:MAG: hypothetical protein ACOYKN_18110 [Pirellula sp.]